MDKNWNIKPLPKKLKKSPEEWGEMVAEKCLAILRKAIEEWKLRLNDKEQT